MTNSCGAADNNILLNTNAHKFATNLFINYFNMYRSNFFSPISLLPFIRTLFPVFRRKQKKVRNYGQRCP